MICFDQGTRRFNYRVVGVAIHDDAVLLHRATHEMFWTLPGGRAEHGETAEQAIRREMSEELGVAVDVVRLLWLVENFFDYGGLNVHEVALYFLIRFPPGSAALTRETFDTADVGAPLQFKWFAVDRGQLAALPILPAFLAEGLTDLPNSIGHIVQRGAAASSTIGYPA